MKKLFLLLLMVLFFIPKAWATDGGAIQSLEESPYGIGFKLKLVCTGSSVDGSLPAAQGIISSDYMAKIRLKYFLYEVRAYPTSSGTAPDAADVTVNMDGQDLLGGKGVNLIHATATYDNFP